MTFIQQWLMTSRSILIQGVQLNIDRTCDFVISTFDNVECSELSDAVTLVTEAKMSDNVVATTIGCTAAAVVLVIIIGFVIFIIIWKRSVK